MPKVGYVERTIRNIDGIDVEFMKNKLNVRSEVQLPHNIIHKKSTKDYGNVAFFKKKLKDMFPGYDFRVLDGLGNVAHGNTLLGTLRETYKNN